MTSEILQDRFISVNGTRTRYWAAGEKETAIILVHGLGGFIESWMNNIIPLAEKHRVYALDLLGFGQSDKTPLVHDMKNLVSFIHDFMENLGIPKAALIGNSMGGGLILQFALDYPGMVEKLVLVDNAGMGRDVLADFKWCSFPVLNNFFMREDRNSTTRLLKKLVYDESKLTPEFIELSFKYSSAPGAAKALMTTLCAGINLRGQKDKLTRQLLDKLDTIKAPTLIIWGKQDRIIPVAHAQIAVKKIPGARLEIFDHCGHMPMYEQPDKFNRLVLDFLAEKMPIEELKLDTAKREYA